MNNKTIRKIIAFPLIYLIYYIGDIWSKVAYKFDTWEFAFNMYQRFMDWSVRLEEWNDTQYIWKKIDEEINS